MKTLKKLFSVSAIVALLGTLVPMYAFAANYSDELQEAYAYAYTNGITTMKSIDAADMYGSLTRVAMAKMIANYATTVLGLTPDTSAKCTFTDVTAALDAQYDNGVTKACQLGLMGQNITAFRPNDLVTRAEFGTTLSRALNANSDDLAAMNAADPYYKDHLNFLKAEGIMNQIDNPSMTEVRGYVMLMMMRADEGYTPNEKCSLEEMVACALADDTDACLAACTGNEEPEEPVGNGLAKVSRVGSASTIETPRVAMNVKIGTIKLTAGEYDTKVSSVELTKSGLGAFAADTITVGLVNGNIETDYASVSTSTDKVKVKFSPALTIKAGKSETFDVMVNVLAGQDNATYSFSVTNIVVSNGTAEGTPVQLGTIKTTSSMPKFVDVTLEDGLATVKAGDTDKLIGKINVSFDESAGTLNRISLANTPAGTPTAKLGDAFTNVNAYVDGTKVGSVNVQDDKIVISNLNIKKNQNEEVLIELKADVIYDDADAYFAFTADSIDITQEGYEFGLVPSTWPAGPTSDIHVVGNNITFKKVALTTKEYLPGAKNITMFDATFKSAIDARITGVVIEGTTQLTTAILQQGSAKIVINGEDFELADADVTTSPLNISLTGKKIDIDANTEVHVKVVLSTKKPLSSVAYPVNMESQYKVTLAGRGLDNVNNVFNTPTVNGDKVTIKEGTAEVVAATLTAPATRSLFPNMNQEIGRFAITADGDDLTLNGLTLTYATTITGADDVEALFDGNFTLVDAESNDIISADFDLSTASGELVISNIKDFEVANDATANLKLMVDLGSLDGFYGKTMLLSVKANSIDAKTSIRTIDTNASIALSDTGYKMRIVAPDVKIEKVSEKKFKVTIKNLDNDTAIDVDDLRYRVVTTVANSDFAGNVCLTENANVIECGTGHAFGAWATESLPTSPTTIAAKQSKTLYIVVDGTSIEPEVLQADISKLSYAETTKALEEENYAESGK